MISARSNSSGADIKTGVNIFSFLWKQLTRKERGETCVPKIKNPVPIGF